MEIPPEELCRLLCNFHITATKKYNSKYATDAMSSFSQSIQRFLDENNAKVNILKEKKIQGIEGSPEMQTSGIQEPG